MPASCNVLRARLTRRGAAMPGSHDPRLSRIERPRCLHCQTRTNLAGVASGPAGYELRTFECPKCDRAQRTLVVSNPMSGDGKGWLGGGLTSPN